MARRLLYIALLLWGSTVAYPQQTLRIMSYNVENLFYPADDSTHLDDEFTPNGARHWNFTRYRRKLRCLAQVIVNIADDWKVPAIIGLQEVEEARCLDELCTYYLRSRRYRYVLFEGPDVRGIDVGLIYDTTQVTLLSAKPIPVPIPPTDRPTRDILYTRFLLPDSTCLHVFTCHLPSQLGGHNASEARRKAAHRILAHQADSILLLDPDAAIVMMGDFNASPQDNLPPLTNLMMPMAEEGKGTEKYRGYWSCLDQFFVSPALLPIVSARIFDADYLLEPDHSYLGTQPKRTYKGFRYQADGYSDHLPIILEWTTNEP